MIVLTRTEITFTFNGDDFGRALLPFATDLSNICLKCVVGVAHLAVQAGIKNLLREKRYDLSYMYFILIK